MKLFKLKQMGSIINAQSKKAISNANLKKGQMQVKQQQLQKSIKFNAIIEKIKQRYNKYITSTYQTSKEKQKTKFQKFYDLVRSIFINSIEEKLMLFNEDKMSFQTCRMEISKFIIQVEIVVLKFVQSQIGNKAQNMKDFFEINDIILVKLIGALKTMFQRLISIQAGQLIKKIKEFDQTKNIDYDIFKNSGFSFYSENEPTNTIKLFINKIIVQLDNNYLKFSEVMTSIDNKFKINKRISDKTNKYCKFNTNCVQINSIQLQTILIQWMQGLNQRMNKQLHNMTQQNKIKKMLEFQKEMKQSFNQFHVDILKILNELKTFRMRQITKRQLQIIKYTSDMNSFIRQAVSQRIISIVNFAIKNKDDFKNSNILRFDVFNIMRCFIEGNSHQLFEIYQKLLKSKQIQIVQVKSLSKTSQNIIRIYFKLKNCFIICLCQLILIDEHNIDDKKAKKNSEKVNKFFSKIQNSSFGVLGQISIFLASQSDTALIYQKNIQWPTINQKLSKNCTKRHKKQKQNDKNNTARQQSCQLVPFVCSKCTKFYSKLSNRQSIYECKICYLKICNKCMDIKIQLSNENNLGRALTEKIDENKQQFEKSLLYIQNKEFFRKQFQKITADMVLKQVFQKRQIFEDQIIQQNYRYGKIKTQIIIKFIRKTQNFQLLYPLSDLQYNFMLVTWINGSVRFNCYRYDHFQNIIIHAFQSLQKYQLNDNFQINQCDLFYQIKYNQKYIFTQIKQKINQQSHNALEILKHGFYLFQGQQRQQMVKQYQKINKFNREQIDQYLLITHKIKSIQKPYDIQSLQEIGNQNSSILSNKFDIHLIIDVIKLYKRGKSQQKLNLYLFELQKNNRNKRGLDLTQMFINNEQIKKINLDIQWLQKIKYLNVRNNKITDIAAIHKTFMRLEKLNVSENKLQKIELPFQLPSLHQLDASKNQLYLLTDLLFIKNINILDLSNNKLESLSLDTVILQQNRQKFSNLKELNLSYNLFENLKEFQQKQSCFPALNSLNLKGNRLVKIPHIQLEYLEQINLQDNLIADISGFCNSKCSNLINLYLKNNNLQAMPKLNFQSVVLVDISYNKFSNVADILEFTKGQYYLKLLQFRLSIEEPSKGLPKLGPKINVFGLQNSYLEDKHVQSIIQANELKFLKQLYLGKNQIQSLPNIQKLNSLRLLFLEQNPISNFDNLKGQEQKSKQQKLKKQKRTSQIIRNKQQRYKNLDHFWLSIDVQNFEQQKKNIRSMIIQMQNLKTKNKKSQSQQIQKQLQRKYSQKVVCLEYDQSSVFLDKKQQIKKSSLRKRQYLMDIFGSETIINQRFKKVQNGYQLDHGFVNIDMNRFVQCDWNEVYYIDLRICGIKDQDLNLFTQNYYRYPNIAHICLYGNQIENIPDDFFKKFTKLTSFQHCFGKQQYRLTEKSLKLIKKVGQTIKSIQIKKQNLHFTDSKIINVIKSQKQSKHSKQKKKSK